MTPDAFEEAGYELLMCYGSRHCSVLPHAHARLCDGAEYCAIGEVIFLTAEFVLSMAHCLPQTNPCEWISSIIADLFIETHPAWPLKVVIIRKLE